MKEKKNFFTDFFKKMLFIPSLAATAVSLFAFIVLYQNKILTRIVNDKSMYVVFAIVAAVFAIVTSYFLIFNLFKKQANLTDAVAFFIALTGIAFFCYFLIKDGELSARRVIVSVLPFVYGLLFVILRVALFNKVTEENASEKCTVDAYYSNIISKFTPVGILLSAVIVTCFAWLIFAHTKTFALTCGNKILFAFAIILLLVYIAKEAGSKKVNLLDGLLLACLIALPAAFAFVFGAKLGATSKARNVILLITATVMIVLFTVIRWLGYDKNSANKTFEAKINCKNGFTCYFSQFKAKFSVIEALAVGTLLALVGAILFRHDLWTILKKTTDIKNVSGTMFPFVALNATVQLTALTSVILSIINIKSKDITCADFLTVASISYGIFTVPSMLCADFICAAALAFVCFAAALALLSARIHSLRKA